MIDLKRLAEDLDYWVSVAPPGATHYVKDTCLFPWRNLNNTTYYRHGNWLKMKKQITELRGVIAKPTQKKWSGPKDGLPPIGSICHYHDYEKGLVPTRILAHHPDGQTVWHESEIPDGFAEGASYSTDSPNSFSPYSEEHEKLIKAAASELEKQFGQSDRLFCDYCRVLHNTGYLNKK